jgi:Putative DNA-binding domain
VTREAGRQQALLRALWRDEIDLRALALRADADAGLAAYRANAGALAERALGAAYPTVAALVGEPSFAALARALWQRHPPERGDLAEWGAALPDFIAASADLASEPYLADSARLDWAVHRAARAADDDDGAPLDLQPLAEGDPSRLRLALQGAGALIASAWPVVAIWHAHQPGAQDAPDRFAAVRAAFAAGTPETAWVWRDGYAVRVDALDGPAAAFTRALQDGRTLADALDLSGSGFAFDTWLARAIGSRWIVAITQD